MDAIAAIKASVKDLHLEQYFSRYPVVYNVSHFRHLPARSCNQSVVDTWKEWVRANPVKSNIDYLESNRKTNWTSYAKNAIHAAAKAFELVGIPLIASDGTALGWYRECGIIEHTGDIDFLVPVDYIVSQKHLELLKVRMPFHSWTPQYDFILVRIFCLHAL